MKQKQKTKLKLNKNYLVSHDEPRLDHMVKNVPKSLRQRYQPNSHCQIHCLPPKATAPNCDEHEQQIPQYI